MKCKLLRDMTCKPTLKWPEGIKPEGTILSTPQAWVLVRMGVAEPADEACKKRAERTPEQIVDLAARYTKLDLGITQDDSAAYDRGEMIGYDADGEWIRGPNYQDEEYDLEELEEDDPEFDDDDDEYEDA